MKQSRMAPKMEGIRSRAKSALAQAEPEGKDRVELDASGMLRVSSITAYTCDHTNAQICVNSVLPDR